MLNRVILVGRLTKDPEIRTTQSGTSVVLFTVASDRPFANKQTGEREADFISCQAWRQTAEFVSKYFRKGSMIIVEGALRNNNYTDQNGVKHYSMVVQVDNVSFGESKKATEQQQTYNQPQQNNYNNQYSQQQQPNYNQQYAPQQNPPQQNPQQFVQQAQQQNIPTQQTAPQSLSIGDLGDFEEIISDGDLPF